MGSRLTYYCEGCNLNVAETDGVKHDCSGINKEYPIKDGRRRHYIRYPIQKKVGVWHAVDVVKSGGYISLIAPVNFKTEKACQKSCDIHNEYHKFSPKEIDRILNLSFKANKGKRKTNGNKRIGRIR